MATLEGYTYQLYYSTVFGLSLGFSTRPIYSGSLLGTTVFIILSIYIGLVTCQVDDEDLQSMQSIPLRKLHFLQFVSRGILFAMGKTGI